MVVREEMGLTWNVKQNGVKKSVTFTLQGLDAYTNEQVAGSTGTGSETMLNDVSILLKEAVVSHMDGFCGQLQNHFDDIAKNGRKISVRIKVWDSFEDGLEAEFDGMELSEIIENWMDENCVNGSAHLSDATENMMYFDVARIPLKNEKGREIDARRFVSGLRKYLKDTYEIESKLMMNGLGQAQLVIGGK